LATGRMHVDDWERLWLVDAHNLGSGPVAYDLAEAVLSAFAECRWHKEMRSFGAGRAIISSLRTSPSAWRPWQ
jgi:hypothetical protein